VGLGVSVRRGQCCPTPDTAGSSQSQLVLAGSEVQPSQHIAHHQSWWHLCENTFKKRKNAAQQTEEKSVRNSPAIMEARGRGTPDATAEIHLQPTGTPQWSRYSSTALVSLA